MNSKSLDSCVPAPMCQSKTYNFDNLDRVVSNTKYLGDASKADWVSSGQPLSHNGQVLLTMAEGTVGTLLASTSYVWYGKTKATFSTGAGAGVVTAFILLGDSKDEIDFEMVGVELTSAQTNFYSQGVTNCKFCPRFSSCQFSLMLSIDNNGGNTTGLTDTNKNMHDYEIDWTPDTITWSIDGKTVRSLDREETWNATANRYSFPQTPSRVQLSLWPGGLPTNGEGTIDWAGGLVTWDSPYMTNGYYYAAFDSVSVECYDPPTGAKGSGNKAYIYTDKAMTNLTVEMTNDNTVLKSLLGTGTNMSADYAHASASDVATVPGLTGAGPGTNGQRPDNGSDSSSSSGSNDGGDNSGSNTASTTGSASTGFIQGGGGANGAGQIGGNSETALKGSLFAVIVAIVGLCVL